MYKFLRAQALRLIKMQGAEYFSYGRVVKCHHNYWFDWMVCDFYFQK